MFDEAKKQEIEQSLIERKLMEPGDTLEITEKGDYWEKFLIFNSQTRGYYYFTKERLIFIGGVAGSTFFSIKYINIKSINKCNISLFIPTGIKLEVFDEKKNKIKKYRMSVLNRSKWIEVLNSKTNKN